MKCKVFIINGGSINLETTASNLESKINTWLNSDPTIRDIKKITQTSARYETVIIVWYQPKEE